MTVCIYSSPYMFIPFQWYRQPVAMDNRVQLQLIVQLLLVTVCAAETKKREISYNLLGEGQKILGKIGTQYTAKSGQECSLRYVVFIFNDKQVIKYLFY